MSESQSLPGAAARKDPIQPVPGSYPASNPTEDSGAFYNSIAEAVKARKEEYTSPRSIRVKIGTWNVAALQGCENDLGAWFVNRPSPDPATDPNPIDVYALGLQEIIDLSSATGALRPFADPADATRFKTAISNELPTNYQLVSEQQLVGLLLLIYASPSVARDIRSVSSTSVGTGLMGYMGNKGAVVTELILGEGTRVKFVNCHMSSGTQASDVQRRNWDALQIANRAVLKHDFEGDDRQSQSSKIGDEDYAFWFGDLNYRIEGIPSEDVRKILTLHTQNRFGVAHE